MLTSVQQTLTIAIVMGIVPIAMVHFLAPATQALVEMENHVQVTINSCIVQSIRKTGQKSVFYTSK